MFDYIFLYPQFADEFADWLKQQGVATRIRDEEDGRIVEVPDDLDDALDEAVDAMYERLLEKCEAQLAEESPEESGYHMAGITVRLQDGTVSYADISPDLLARVMTCITPEEFATIVDAIATAVEMPQRDTYCQRVRNGEAS